MEDLTRNIEVFASINIIVLGMSYLLRPDAWRECLAYLESKGAAGSLTTAFLGVAFGSFIVAFHNIWGGIPTILTVFGWVGLLKGAVFAVFPGLALQRFATAQRMGNGLWRGAGVLWTAVGILVLQHALGG